MFRTKDFSYENKDGVAFITFDAEGEPVNTLSPDVGRQYEQLLTRTAQDADCKAIVSPRGRRTPSSPVRTSTTCRR